MTYTTVVGIAIAMVTSSVRSSCSIMHGLVSFVRLNYQPANDGPSFLGKSSSGVKEGGGGENEKLDM